MIKRLRAFFRLLFVPTCFYLDDGKPIRLSIRQAWWISEKHCR